MIVDLLSVGSLMISFKQNPFKAFLKTINPMKIPINEIQFVMVDSLK